TGAVVWWSEPGGAPTDSYYSVPVVAVINGQRLLITGGADGGLHAMQVRTGKHVWSYKFAGKAVHASPVVDGTLVYCTHGEENPEADNNEQGRIVCIDTGQIKNGKPKLVWQVDGIKVKYTSPIIHEGRLYVCDDIARLFCMDGKTGEIHWKYAYGR